MNLRRLTLNLILPIFVFNLLLTNQVWSDALLWAGRLFYWILLFLSFLFLILMKSFIKKNYIISIFILMMFCKISSLLFPEFEFLYLTLVMLIFIFVGVCAAKDYSTDINSQVRFFIWITALIMAIQVSGISEYSHFFNTLYTTRDISSWNDFEINLFPSLFKSRDELLNNYYEVFVLNASNQLRPPGLLHSHALNTLFILVIAAFYFGRNVKSGITPTFYCIIFALVFTGSRAAQIIFIFMIFFLYFFNNKHYKVKRNTVKISFIYILMIIFYSLCVPAAFEEFSLNSILFSLEYRFGNFLSNIAPSFLNNNFFQDVNASYELILEANKIQFEDASELSGLVSLLYFVIILLFSLMFYFPKIKASYKYYRLNDSSYLYSSLLVMLTILLILFSSPFISSIFYWFCFGIAISPLLHKNNISK